MNNYTFFWHGPFSQWAPCKFHILKEHFFEFNCAEQWMMWSKANLFGDSETAKKILEAPHPKEQKALGRIVKNFDPTIWEKHCDDIVFLGNWAKFTQSQRLKKILLETSGLLVEASPLDPIWGIGMAEDNPEILDTTKWGQNKLGKILTRVRDILKITT